MVEVKKIKLLFFDSRNLMPYWGNMKYRGVAQPGSVLAWGASGRPFKSARPDHNKKARESRDSRAFLIKIEFSSISTSGPCRDLP